MISNKKRPVHLYLPSIHLPITGLVSFAHRISGVLMVSAIPFAIYLLQLSLQGPEGFDSARQLMQSGPVKLLLLLLGWALIHHLFAGLRFLALDLDLGVDKAAARRSAWTVLAAAIVGAIGLIGLVL